MNMEACFNRTFPVPRLERAWVAGLRARLDALAEECAGTGFITSRCRRCITFWRSLSLLPRVDAWLWSGISVPFIHTTRACVLSGFDPNYASCSRCEAHCSSHVPVDFSVCVQRRAFVAASIAKDVAAGAKCRWSDIHGYFRRLFGREPDAVKAAAISGARPKVFSRMGVAFESGVPAYEGHVISDCRYVNSHFEKRTCTLEQMRTVCHLMDELRDLLAGDDLSSAYFHFFLNVSLWWYMGFVWEGMDYFQPSLPFGVSFVVPVFEENLGFLYCFLRQHHLHNTHYLDDCLSVVPRSGVGPSGMTSRAEIEFTLSMKVQAGCLINWGKTHPWGKLVKIHLDHVVDVGMGTLSVPTHRRRRTWLCGQALLASIVEGGQSSALLGAQFVGNIVSMYLELLLQHHIFMHLIFGKVAVATGLPVDVPRYQLERVWAVPLLFSWDAGIGVFVLMQMLMDNTSVPLGGNEPSLHEVMICADTSVSATGGTCSVPGVAGISELLPDCMVGTSFTH